MYLSKHVCTSNVKQTRQKRCQADHLEIVVLLNCCHGCTLMGDILGGFHALA